MMPGMDGAGRGDESERDRRRVVSVGERTGGEMSDLARDVDEDLVSEGRALRLSYMSAFLLSFTTSSQTHPQSQRLILLFFD